MTTLIERIARPADDKCPICWQEFSATTEKICTLLSCTHLFHQDCLKEWFQKSVKRSASCPLCFTKVSWTAKRIKHWGDSLLTGLQSIAVGGSLGGIIGRGIDFFQGNTILQSKYSVLRSGSNCISEVLKVHGDQIQKKIIPFSDLLRKDVVDSFIEKMTNTSYDLAVESISACGNFEVKYQEMNAIILNSHYGLGIAIGTGLTLGLITGLAIIYFKCREKESASFPKPVYVDATT